jgi:NAD(P)-dependent dehydrogenase (short-subunit alcohol dehydrogenase family)
MALTDQVAVLVGATGQLGPAVAKAFLHAGVKLVLVGTREQELNSLFKELGFRESRVIHQVADAMDPASMHTLAEAVKERFGSADILLNIAGGYRGGSLLETPNELWDLMLNMNLRTAVNSIRAFLPLMIANDGGRILTVSSGITQAPPANVAAYVTAKAALEAMTLAVAQEVKDKKITANVVLIRALDTPAERAKQPDKKTGWVKPEDVAATLLFLCSAEGIAITGARIPVYGSS